MKWNSKNTYAVIIFFSILIMTFCVHYVYTFLGGYQEVVVYHLGADHRLVVGRSFSGRQTSKTIEKYLGSEYTVRSSIGHIRDLPKTNKDAIDINGGFIPRYVVSAGKQKVISFPMS